MLMAAKSAPHVTGDGDGGLWKQQRHIHETVEAFVTHTMAPCLHQNGELLG